MSATSIHNPYPGARPLSPAQADALVGRSDLVYDFADLATRHPVLLVLGPSGVGKSSFLQAGVEQRLSSTAGWQVRSFRNWARLPAGDHAGVNYALLLARVLDEQDLSDSEIVSDPMDFIDWVHGVTPQGTLAERLSGRRLLSSSNLVIVLDQFEELLRHQPEIGRGLLEAVKDAVRVYKSTKVTYVISLRQEFEHELRSLSEIGPGIVKTVKLKPLHLEHLTEIVRGPLDQTTMAAAGSLLEALKYAWCLAAGRDAHPDDVTFSPDETGLGLLHFQAFLYNLFEKIKGQDLSEISAEAASNALGVTWPTGKDEARKLFGDALTTYVDLRLQAAYQRATSHLGTEVADETLSMVARIVPRLSSAGYKLIHSVDELASELLSELHELHYNPGEVDSAAEPYIQQGVRKARSLNLRREPGSSLAEVLEELFDEGWGSASMVCGRMADASVFETASEVIKTYLRALDWLEDPEVAILRTTKLTTGAVMVAIVHDGFGPALMDWSSRTSRIPRLRASSLVKLTGKQVLRLGTDEEESLDPTQLTSTAHLGWVGCNVTARFRDIVFDRCDFGGTLFNQCVFENVTFNNCKMWGTLFIGCEFTGTKGVIVATDFEPGADEARIQTLTFGRGCVAREGGVTLRGYGGYGYFIDRAAGGPWIIEDSDVQHVGFFQGDVALGPVVIRGPRTPTARTTSQAIVVDDSGG